MTTSDVREVNNLNSAANVLWRLCAQSKPCCGRHTSNDTQHTPQGEHWLAAMKGHEVGGMAAEDDRKRLLLERFQLEVCFCIPLCSCLFCNMLQVAMHKRRIAIHMRLLSVLRKSMFARSAMVATVSWECASHVHHRSARSNSTSNQDNTLPRSGT